MLSFSILGALEIRTPSGPAEIPGGLQRTLVQALLVSEGQAIAGDTLINEMWGESVPENEANALQAHVSRLRRRLKGLESERPASRLSIHPSGYRLSLEAGELDAAEFISLVRRAEAASGTGRDEAAALTRTALAMWRGPVFGGHTGGPVCQTAAARYEEYRMRALELFFDAELKAGHHAAILAELREVHAGNPLREYFCEQLMIALYRSGRQADALDTYRRMWHRLSEELGVEPSPALRRVEHAILSHHPALSTTGDARSALLEAV
ncbi:MULTISPECIES: AfsR/SARP family transcriptional regulator [Streptomyces]|uniref:AfsR/SARP family transcriptional regulator n=2 Tax=Streptomyces TaxID=1883 RepID=A0A939FSZ5_9ACTN|nr:MULTISPECIES: AfsR/SARP family transcriptional regulator [Streptomyces]MBO0656148.1 AfsR/SARP family transcriptional regulator [Streptomyces triculaminicus]QSY50128.1 AfsR/SARP family transcriptional regulator [Streptomyces griseocarneus]